MKPLEHIIDFCQKHISDQATLQNFCGTAAMFLSCMAFTGSVLFNKGIPKEQKEFLVSQELADGAINVALFWTLTGHANKLAKKAVENGRIFPSELKEKAELIRKKVGENATFKEMTKHFSPEELKKIDDFHSGVKNTVSLGGSLLAASIITPIIRNVIASKFQQRNDDKKPNAQAIQQKPAQVATVATYAKPQQGNNLRKPVSPAYTSFQSGAGLRV